MVVHIVQEIFNDKKNSSEGKNVLFAVRLSEGVSLYVGVRRYVSAYLSYA